VRHRETSTTVNRQRSFVGLLASVAVAFWPAASLRAQYSADGPEDLQKGAGVRYFGSAKDAGGARLADVSFLFETGQASFVFVTDATGRFRGMLPLDTLAKPVTAKCWKAGLQPVRIDRRPGPKTAPPSVQVDCVLRASPQP